MQINFDLLIYIMWAISGVNLVVLFTMSMYYFVFWTISGKKTQRVPHSDKYTKFAVLIAARDESKVIRNIFNSLKEQTYNKDYYDVWVIVESIKDETCHIAEEYGYHYFVRDKLTPDRKTKGFALQECIDHFDRENLHYDAYMIFDADNVMDKDYLESMNDLRQTGVRVAVGYRNFTNANENWLTVGSAIMFAYMNQITSKGRSILFHKATLMGTGYYVDSQIIDEAGGWIFTGMTEDIQLTTYCYYHDLHMRYYPVICFYDEQSPDYKTVHKQHLRWLFGYFERRRILKKTGLQHNYHPKNMQSFMRFEFNTGIVPFVVFNVVSAVIAVLGIVFGALAVYKTRDPFYYGMLFGLAGYSLFMIWLVFAIPAFIVVYRNNDRMKLSKKNVFIGITTYLFYFSDFVLAFFDGLFHPSKRTTWSKIEHSGEIMDDDAKKAS